MLYEYKIKKLRILSISEDDPDGGENNIKQTVADLNKWARDDWELVSVVPAGAEWLAFLKRPVR